MLKRKMSLFLVLLFLLFPLLVAFTYEGEMNPEEFLTWAPIPGTERMVNAFVVSVVLANSDQTSKIKKVRVFIFTPTSKLIGYRYFKGNELFMYVLDMERNKYIRKYLSESERRDCASCHKSLLGKKA